MTRIAVIVAAGGSGSRMGATVPKQFLPLSGRPVLMRTIERLAEALPSARIVVSLPAAELGRWEELRREYGCTVEHAVVRGGADRFHSVFAALTACGDCDLIAVHDGVRPLAPVAMIRGVVAEAEKHGAAIPAVIPVDSFRWEPTLAARAETACGLCLARRRKAKPTPRRDSLSLSTSHMSVRGAALGEGSEADRQAEVGSTPVDRTQLRAVQTPQVFHAAMLRDAYRRAAAVGVDTTASAASDPPHRRSGRGEVQADPPPTFRPPWAFPLTDDSTVVEWAGHAVRLCPGDQRNIKITTELDMAVAEALLKYE